MENSSSSPSDTPSSPNSKDIRKRSDYVSDLIYPLLLQKLDTILTNAKIKTPPPDDQDQNKLVGSKPPLSLEENHSTTTSPSLTGGRDGGDELDLTVMGDIVIKRELDSDSITDRSSSTCFRNISRSDSEVGVSNGISCRTSSTSPDPADVPSLKEQLIRSGLLSSSDPIFTSPVNRNSNLKPIIPPISTSTLDLIRSRQRTDNSTNDCIRPCLSETSNNIRDLTEKLLKCKTDILLKTTENLPSNNQLSQGLDALDKLVKTEQLIQLLQANQQQIQRNVAPSIILGGNKNAKRTSLLNNKRKTDKDDKSKRSNKKMKHCGGSHPIQLWHFILELLGDISNKNIISWTGNGLEFRILNSVELARLWGIRKCNPIMNFDKLSRALRYYYEKNIIKHNPMHRLVYSFCDNPHDIAYNALLNKALISCPIDPECAKNQAAFGPYGNGGSATIPISVSLQSVHNLSHITDNKTNNTSISVTEQ